jgi:hypothetical protein
LIRDAIAALGGPTPHGSRFSAWWRGSKALNCSIAKDGLTCFDHVTGRGGDSATLVQEVIGCDIREALAWLEARGLREQRQPLTRLELQRRGSALEAEQARRESAELFRVALDAELDTAKLAACDVDDDEALERSARLQGHLGKWPDVVLALAVALNPREVQRLIDAGRADRHHAAAITAAAVQLISRAA